jgi:hypothetical protein
MTQASIPDPQGLAEELNEIIANLTSLEAIVYEEPTRLSDEEQQEIRQELAALKIRLRKVLQ